VKHRVSRLIVAALLLGSAAWVLAADAGSPLTSTKDHGVVSLQPDSALSDGRLMIKVVAFNRNREVASFGSEDVQITTAAGKPVVLIPLDQLIAEARGAEPAERSRTFNHNPSAYSGPTLSRNDAGEPNVDSYTGSQAPVGGVVSSHTDTGSGSTARKSGKVDPAVEQQVVALQAAILHPMTIPAGSAAGGQIVTEKLRFKRKDDRTLRVVVAFNGEQHEFSVPAPEK
jgi:hypothetical protein